ncbi:DNA polymerase III subunit alpha [Candidatus Marinimicrobia bacterium MT.SAG.3]|nr:DNA polymerase III subunit alpha [Candidatus Marinimicrobia bacterium MT.SAG.3]
MFLHLHTHSNYSFCRGADTIRDLCTAAKLAGMEKLALTDTNGLYGMHWFIKAAKEEGVIPIIGTQLVDDGANAVLLAKDESGYSALCRVISERHRKREKGEKNFSLRSHLQRDRQGLIVLSGSIALLETLAKDNGSSDLYVELSPLTEREELLRFSKKTGVPLVATNAVHFILPERYKLHRLLRAIDLNTTLSRIPESELVTPECWFKGATLMTRLHPNTPEALENTLRISEACKYEGEGAGFVFPSYNGGDEEATYKELEAAVWEGAKMRYGAISDKVRGRISHEMRLVKEKRFASYFMVVRDIVSRSNRTCGRGSAAASIIAYTLSITHVDPIKHNLFFERFLNEGRLDPPDIDVDFPWDERDDVLDYVFNKYGSEHSAMVSNHVRFKARSALREVAKVYGIPDNEIRLMTKRMRHLYDIKNTSSAMNGLHFKDVEFPEPWPEMIIMADSISKYPRYMSVHCGGVVITPDAITDHVPIMPSAKGVNIIQWEKEQTERAGLVKIDLLGNRSLAVIRDALAAIKTHYNITINYARWNPLVDHETQELIKRGDTIGVFYVESPAMRQLQIKAKTGDFEHLVIHSSMIRPAANKFINEYVRRLHGGDFEPLHPMMLELMPETYGIMCYQEDVAKVAMLFAGFSASDSDVLRKIISWKEADRELRDYRDKFFSGCTRNGFAKELIEELWEMIMSFAGYSFCKPHSASFAMVSYKSAYLRAHYPAEFMAAVISNQGGYYSPLAYISECRRMKLQVLMPDVNESRFEYTGIDNRVRVGLMQLKGFTAEASERLLEERKKSRFRSFDDFLRRVNMNPSDVRVLIKSGAFDGVEPRRTRPELMWRLSQKTARRRKEKAVSEELFDYTPDRLPKSPEYSAKTMLTHEQETLGFLMSRHPLTLYHEQIRRAKPVRASRLHEHIGERVRTIGWLVTGKIVRTKNDELMEFYSFEDTTALYETVFFPKTYARFCNMISTIRPYVLTGRVDCELDAITLNVYEVRFL